MKSSKYKNIRDFEPMMKMPENIEKIFEEKGILQSAIRLYFKSDMGINLEFCDAWVVITDSEMAILETLGGIFPRKTHSLFDGKKIQVDTVVRDFRAYSFDDFENFHAEELKFGGRVVAYDKNTQLDTVVFNYSNTVKDGVFLICRAVTDSKVTQEEIFNKKDGDKPPFSPHDRERPPFGPHRDRDNSQRMKKGESKRMIYKLLPFFVKYKGYMLVVLVMVILSSLLGLLTPYMSGSFFIDKVLGNVGDKFYGQIAVAIAIIAGTKFLSTFFLMIHSIVTAKISARVVYDLKHTIFSSIQKHSLSFFSSRQTGGLMTQINQDSRTLYWFFVDGLPYFVTNILQFIVIIMLLIKMNWRLSLIVITTIPVFIILRRAGMRASKKMHARVYSRSRIFNSFVSDILSGNRVVKAFSREELEQKKFDSRNSAYAQASYGLRFMHIWYLYPVNIVLDLGTYLAWAIGGYMVIRSTVDGSMLFTYGTLVTYISMLAMAYAPLNFFNGFTHQFTEFMNATHRLFQIMDAIPEVRDAEKTVVPENFQGEVEFKNVSFEYEKNRRVIDNVSFKVNKGETIGIVGHTGAGKSTIVNLIMRLYDVTDGEIFIDGINVKNMPMSYIRDKIAIVSQETYVFRGSVADNIRYAVPDASDEQVIEAAKASGAHDFIIKYPDGYNTQIGFGNKGLSGGELQRVSIARAILKNPDILILDEATAAMDTATEQRIQNAITQITKDKTTIIIAHRLSTLKDADRLIVIEDGKMTETGTHKELIEAKGDYYKLYKMQLEALKLIGVEE